MLKTFRLGGIHPPQEKLTSGCKLQRLEPSKEYIIAMSQHIGSPASCCVKKGDHVTKYSLLGKSDGFISANVHSPISGTVKKIDKIKNAFGFEINSIVIEPDGNDEEELHARSNDEIASLTAEEIVSIVDNAGIVGLGGATFPTKVKLTPPKETKVDTLLINGAECEPFLTNDQELMEECPKEIVEGISLLMRATKISKAIIAIENNKPDAISSMKKAVANEDGIEVITVKTKYPQGGEKQLIEATTGRIVPSGGLPAAVGVIVQNIATAYAVREAVYCGKPLVERVVTVTGLSVKNPGNFIVPIGTPISDLIEAAGGMPSDSQKVILGGPMMGKAASNIMAGTTKGISGILIVPQNMAKREKAENCIRCASCVSVCPMGLEPYLLARLSEMKDYERLEKEHVTDCIECGSCSYICISHRPILDYIRIGKQRTVAMIKSRKNAKNG